MNLLICTLKGVYTIIKNEGFTIQIFKSNSQVTLWLERKIVLVSNDSVIWLWIKHVLLTLKK